MNKLVTVIIPTFNRSYILPRAIESVLTQTYKPLEIIVVDDGSTDCTKKVCAKYNVKYYFQENGGVSSARNLGIKNALGEYIAFLDSDDEWFNFKLEKQVPLLESSKLNIVHSNEQWIRNGVRVNPHKKHIKGGGDQFLRSLDFCVISPSTVIVRKNIFNVYGLFREDFTVCEDYDLWLKITSCEEVGFIEDDLIKKHGGHTDQLSTKFFAMDYWRIKSLKFILDQNQISEEKKERVVEVLRSKCLVLLKGYTKHNNLDHFNEIETILREIDVA